MANALLNLRPPEESQMSAWQHILVVARNSSRANDIATWLRSDGFPVTVVSTFAAAKVELNAIPALVITELKLGEFNGLHLALRANAAQIPVLVLGESEPFFEREAERLGARFLSLDNLSRERIVSYAEAMAHIDSPESMTGTDIAWIGQSITADSGTPLIPAGTRRMRLH